MYLKRELGLENSNSLPEEHQTAQVFSYPPTKHHDPPIIPKMHFSATTIIALIAFTGTALSSPAPRPDPISVEELTNTAVSISNGEPIPEGVTLWSPEKRNLQEGALFKRNWFCGAACRGDCCCTICSSGRFGEYYLNGLQGTLSSY